MCRSPFPPDSLRRLWGGAFRLPLPMPCRAMQRASLRITPPRPATRCTSQIQCSNGVSGPMPDCPESWLDNRFRCGIRCATKRRFGGGGGLGANGAHLTPTDSPGTTVSACRQMPGSLNRRELRGPGYAVVARKLVDRVEDSLAVQLRFRTPVERNPRCARVR